MEDARAALRIAADICRDVASISWNLAVIAIVVAAAYWLITTIGRQ